MRPAAAFWLLFAVGLTAVIDTRNSWSAEPPTHSAVTPVANDDGWWKERHELINSRTKEQVDLLFIGV